MDLAIGSTVLARSVPNHDVPPPIQELHMRGTHVIGGFDGLDLVGRQL